MGLIQALTFPRRYPHRSPKHPPPPPPHTPPPYLWTFMQLHLKPFTVTCPPWPSREMGKTPLKAG